MMPSMRLLGVLCGLCMLLMSGGAQALRIETVPGMRIANLEADGEPLEITGPGPLTLASALRTASPSLPGTDGPDILIHIDGVLILEAGTYLEAAPGNEGATDHAAGSALAQGGGRGGTIVVRADSIVSHGAIFQAGNGGVGGDAFATGAPHALAVAGEGGRGGQVIIEGAVIGPILRRDGEGGAGGDADAQGGAAQECSGDDGGAGVDDRREPVPPIDRSGGDANARGESGTCGSPGGRGGDAAAYGGDGGISVNAAGGRGGNATALAGTGGKGVDLCFSYAEAIEKVEGNLLAGSGGRGGNATAIGGQGGISIQGVGGAGGSSWAETRGGQGGNGTYIVASRSGFSEFPGRTVAEPGSGGRPGEVLSRAGDGGTGSFGGGGGGAVGLAQGGDGGDSCQVMPSGKLAISWLGLPSFALLLAFAITLQRRRR